MSGLAEHLRAVTIADVDQAPPPTARLGRYGVWQLRDYFRGVGGATLVLSGLAIVMLTLADLPGSRHGPAAQASVSALLGVLGFVGPIFAASGLVADDRGKGYYRFLLAKPVSPVRFYAQAFALRGAAFLGITAAVWCAGAILFGAGSFIGTMSYAALCFLMIGGVSFLLSTLTRHAWLGTLLLAGVASIASSYPKSTGGWRLVLHALYAVLPPFHQATSLAGAFMEAVGAPHLIGTIAWFGGYGVLAIAAALTVIRGREWPL
jgi:hypothetical protein